MLSLIKTAKHQKVLDIGFGTGFPLLILSQRFGPTCQLYGQDIWEKAMETTEMKIAARGISNVELLRGSASKIDLPDNSVDLVTSNLGINNFAEPEQVIKECRRVLKPGGELVLATNLEGTFQEFYESFDTTLLQMQMTETMGQLREHIRQRPSLEDVTEEFIKHGMNLELAVTDSMNMYYTDGSAFLNDYFIIMSFFVVSTIIFFICYWFTYRNINGKGFGNFFKYIGNFFAFFSIAMGFSLHNSIAVLEGHRGKKSEFVRTPKFNISSLKDSWKGNKYLSKNISPNTVIEGLLALYFFFGLVSSYLVKEIGGADQVDFGLFPFHLMLFIGFGFVFYKSLTSKA